MPFKNTNRGNGCRGSTGGGSAVSIFAGAGVAIGFFVSLSSLFLIATFFGSTLPSAGFFAAGA